MHANGWKWEILLPFLQPEAPGQPPFTGQHGWEGELGFGPAHLLIRAVPVLLDGAGADEHVSAATRRKTGVTEWHCGPEQAAPQSQPPTTQRSHRFKTLIPHLTESHSKIVLPFFTTFAGSRELKGRGCTWLMFQVTAPGVKALSPLPCLMGFFLHLFIMLLLYQHFCQEVGVKPRLLPRPSPHTMNRFILTLPNLPFVSQLPRPRGEGQAR